MTTHEESAPFTPVEEIVRLVPLDDLIAHPRNPKKHANEAIQTSMNRFGFMEPVVVDQRTGYLISGHGRTETLIAARDGGEAAPDGVTVTEDGTWMVPTVVSWASKDDDDAEAALVALNRIGQIGGWDSQSLADILQSLSQQSDGLAGVGYGASDLDLLLRQLDADGKMKSDTTGAIDEFLGISGTGPDAYSAGGRVFRELRVTFASEADARQFFAAIGFDYSDSARSIMYPVPLPKSPLPEYPA